MQLIDTHTHLFTEQFTNDIAEVILRAGRSGISHFLLPNIDQSSVKDLLETCRKFPECRPMWGLHPCHVGADWKGALDSIKPLFEQQPACAVGEIGLDFYWSEEFMAEQMQALDAQLQWAVEMQLPVSLHTREATAETINLVKKYISNGLTGVFHCFSGTEEEASEITGMGFCLGIGGSVTYPKNPIRNFLSRISPDFLVLETDAPYLPPVPYRGKRNEPAFLLEVVHELASLYGMKPTLMAEITSANAKRLFHL